MGTFTPEGPQLSPGDAVSLELPPEQLPLVNAILKVSFQEYLELERRHSTQERNEAGHLVTTIGPFPELFEQFEDRLWSKLDRILGEQQQLRARSNLPIRPASTPGFFGWAGEEVRIETWRDGASYHWTITTRGNSHTHSSPQASQDLERFWGALGEGEMP